MAALRAGDGRVVRLWLDAARRDARAGEVHALAESAGLTIERCSRTALQRLCSSPYHQGVVLEWLAPATGSDGDLQALVAVPRGCVLLLVLDRVQDPHNLGACLRTADGAGASAVVVPRHRAAGYTPAVCKVASGAVEAVPLFRVANLARALRGLKAADVRVIGLDDAAGQPIYDLDLRGPVALVLGAEEAGLRRLTRECCDCLARIPMYGRGQSLNVAVAAGIALYEARRQLCAAEGSSGA